MKEYIPCCICGKKALWSYMPGREDYCDNCVPRGCSCNLDWDEKTIKIVGNGPHAGKQGTIVFHDVKPAGNAAPYYKVLIGKDASGFDQFAFVGYDETEPVYHETLDDKGRRYPCCEYMTIDEERHNDKDRVAFGWETYYEHHPEERRQSDEVEHWEHKLGVDRD
jgi:hypothetical protein